MHCSRTFAGNSASRANGSVYPGGGSTLHRCRGANEIASLARTVIDVRVAFRPPLRLSRWRARVVSISSRRTMNFAAAGHLSEFSPGPIHGLRIQRGGHVEESGCPNRAGQRAMGAGQLRYLHIGPNGRQPDLTAQSESWRDSRGQRHAGEPVAAAGSFVRGGPASGGGRGRARNSTARRSR